MWPVSSWALCASRGRGTRSHSDDENTNMFPSLQLSINPLTLYHHTPTPTPHHSHRCYLLSTDYPSMNLHQRTNNVKHAATIIRRREKGKGRDLSKFNICLPRLPAGTPLSLRGKLERSSSSGNAIFHLIFQGTLNLETAVKHNSPFNVYTLWEN